MTLFRPRDTRIDRQPIHIYAEGAIRAALKGVNDHKTGLPEFMKNSAGAYHRLRLESEYGQSREDRIIVLLFRGPRGRGAGAIGCLDLAGMTQQDIALFQQWFDPTAASRGDPSAELWGGHGNGAKSYMLKMFEERWFATVRESRFTKMGWHGENIQIGYIPSRPESGGVRVADPLSLLDELLQSCFRASLQVLPRRAQDLLRQRPCWTCFVGIDAKNWVNPQGLLRLLQNNPQALRTIEYCSIYAVTDGLLALDSQRLDLQDIPPLPGGESPYEVEVPTRLNDPDGGQVDTTLAGRHPQGKLVLRTSREPMLYTLRHRHIIRCETTNRGVIGVYSVRELAGIQADHIYGELYLESLQEYESNFRTEPHEAPLTRAVKSWLSAQGAAYANHFHQQEVERHSDAERNELQQLNEEMNRFLEQFLEEAEAEIPVEGDEGGGRIIGTGRGALPQGEVARIEHNLGDAVNTCGENGSLYVRLVFRDAEGTQVRPVPVHWDSSNDRVAFAQLGSIITGESGDCDVWAIAENGIRSAPIHLRVIHADSIELSQDTNPLPLGSKRWVPYRVTSDGRLYTDVKLDWHSSNEQFIKVGSNTGIATATGAPGGAQVWATARGAESNRIQIEAVGREGSNTTPHYPKVLLSEINDDPDTGQPKHIDPDAGTVVQDVVDRRRNIYWVNMRSPIADQFYRGEGELSYRSPEFRVYLAERYAEVVFRDALRRADQWEPGDVEDLLRERPTRLRQALASNFLAWLSGEWHLQRRE